MASSLKERGADRKNIVGAKKNVAAAERRKRNVPPMMYLRLFMPRVFMYSKITDGEEGFNIFY